MPSRGRSLNYTPEEDDVIARMVTRGHDASAIGDATGREAKSIISRIYVLRRAGKIPGYERRPRVEQDRSAERPRPPLVLRDDAELVRACRLEGGFPRAVVVGSGQTVWADRHGFIWRHTPVSLGMAA